MGVTAVVLAGGKGTRLRPFTITIPKPLLPVGDLPILEIVIRQLVAAGVERIVLTLGHMAPVIQALLGNGERWGVRIDYSVEDTPLGTAGPLRLIEDPDENILVMNGDVLTTLDYRKLIDFHRDTGGAATLACARRQVNIDFGVTEYDEKGLLMEYKEKPTIHYDVSMGINVLARRTLDNIPEGSPYDMPDLLLQLKEHGEPIHCYSTDCYWMDIGRFDDYQQASQDFDENPGRFLPE